MIVRQRTKANNELCVRAVPVLKGRTGLGVYEDFMGSFMNEFQDMMDTCISEVVIGKIIKVPTFHKILF